MAFQWTRALAVATATLSMTAGLLLPGAVQAASDPCKAHPSSTTCKKQVQKKPSAKAQTKAVAKRTTTTAKTTAATKSAKKTAAKKASKASGKRASAKTAASRRKAAAQAAALASVAPANPRADIAALRSSTAYVQDLETSNVVFAKNENVVRPIASISKLMTALVVVDANLPMDEMLEITEDDVDQLKHSASRLEVGTRLNRGDMLHLALMSSENRAAHALARHYPGGLPAFVAAMNEKARALGMTSTRFVEPTGLSSENVSSPRDLARMVRAAAQRPLIHRYSTDTEYEVEVKSRTQTFRNTNLLVRKPDWDIKVSKTGYINEAGECLVMMARIDGRDLAIVLLDSQGKLSRIGDAVRIRRIVENQVAML